MKQLFDEQYQQWSWVINNNNNTTFKEKSHYLSNNRHVKGSKTPLRKQRRPQGLSPVSDSTQTMGHFRVPKTLTYKMRLVAQPFLWKWVLFAWEWKMISISKAEHLPSFWNRGPQVLANGLLCQKKMKTADPRGHSRFQVTRMIEGFWWVWNFRFRDFLVGKFGECFFGRPDLSTVGN